MKGFVYSLGCGNTEMWDSLNYGNATEVTDIGSVRKDRHGI